MNSLGIGEETIGNPNVAGHTYHKLVYPPTQIPIENQYPLIKKVLCR
jgi:hypothetical protein